MLLTAFRADKRKAEGESHFVRVSERFPLCGRGDVNTYTVFAETTRHIISAIGRAGMIVPSGIATDDTTQVFLPRPDKAGSLVSLYDFENAVGFSQACIVVSNSASDIRLDTSPGEIRAEFVFFAHHVSDLREEQ